MIRQIVNVLIMGTFDPQNTTIAGNNPNTGLYSLTELVSSQLHKLLSSISPNLAVRVGYRAGENTTENEYTLDLETRFLNDRLIIRTNFGYHERQDINAQDRFLGDFIAEYRLSKDGSFRGKMFNVTNPQDITATYSSTYSQGIGLTFSKDFDKLKDLFPRKQRKNKKNPQKQPVGGKGEEE